LATFFLAEGDQSAIRKRKLDALTPLPQPMKIASFNINNINRRLENLLSWLREAEPEVVCLQELKAADTEFPADAIQQAGYHAVWHGEKRWNGVAILARWAPVTRTDLPGDVPDGQCHYLEAAVNGVLVASIYAPNGNPQPGLKFEYKLAWLKRLNAHAADYNVVPTDFDIYETKSWDRDALSQPQSRQAYQRLHAQGWTDAVRALHPNEPMYTFWDYMPKRWERDGGLRIDHLLLSPVLTERLQGAGVDRHIRRLEDVSDHAPVWVELRDAPNPPTSASLGGGHGVTTPTRASSKAKKSDRPGRSPSFESGTWVRKLVLALPAEAEAVDRTIKLRRREPYSARGGNARANLPGGHYWLLGRRRLGWAAQSTMRNCQLLS
jgi:exodeoxyribonuclease-3